MAAGDTVITLVGNLVDDPELRFKAACAVLDRGHGKPKESVDMGLQAEVRGNMPVINLTVTRPNEDGGT